MSEYIARQIEERQKSWHQAKALLDGAASEKRDLSAEESESYKRMSADLDTRAEVIKTLRADEARANEIAEAAAVAPEIRAEAPAPTVADAERLRSLARGEVRSLDFEARDVAKTSTGAPVPTSFYGQVMEKLRYVGPMLDTSTIWNTAGGESLQVPIQNARPSGTINAEAATFGESDPTFSAFITLGAFKYSFLTQLSSELITDSGVDILGYLAGVTGNSLGFAVNTALTTGTGTVQPKGIVDAAAAGITGATGVSGAFTYANLVDLAYSLDRAARMVPTFGVMAGTNAIADMRLLQDGAGSYIFQPSLSESTPDRVLGFNLVENPAMAAPATAAKSVIAGDLASYIVRQVGGIRLDRSDDYAFASDQVTFRAQIRIDGNLPQPSNVKYFIGGAS